MTPDRRIDRLRFVVLTGLGLAACIVPSLACWLAQRVWLFVGPWIMADVDRFTAIAAGLLVLAIGAVTVMARDDPSC